MQTNSKIFYDHEPKEPNYNSKQQQKIQNIKFV